MSALGQWREKDLPSWGSGSEKLVPMAHSIRWAVEYQREKQKNPDGVSRLSMKLVWARHDLRQVEVGEPPIYEPPSG